MGNTRRDSEAMIERQLSSRGAMTLSRSVLGTLAAAVLCMLLVASSASAAVS